MASRKNSFVRSVCLVSFITFAFFFLILEFGVSRIVKVPHLVYRYWGNRPVTYYPSLSQRAVTENYDISFKSNSWGFKDVEHAIPKMPGTYRVLLLGDSYIEAAGVLISEQVSQQMQKIAKEKGHQWEVISIGMSGYGQAQQLSYLKQFGKKIAPDAVVTFFCANDYWNNAYDYQPADFRLDNRNLISQLPQKETPVPLIQKVFRATLSQTESYYIMKHAFERLRGSLGTSKKEMEVAAFALGVSAKMKGASENKSEKEKMARLIGSDYEIDLFRALVREIKREAQFENHALLINTLVSSDVRKESEDFNWFMHWTENSFKELGAPVVNFDSEFRRRSREDGVLPHFESDSHWNATGNRWVAERLVEEILKQNRAR